MRHLTPEKDKGLIELYESLNGDITLEKFTNRLWKLFPKEALDRRTIGIHKSSYQKSPGAKSPVECVKSCSVLPADSTKKKRKA